MKPFVQKCERLRAKIPDSVFRVGHVELVRRGYQRQIKHDIKRRQLITEWR